MPELQTDILEIIPDDEVYQIYDIVAEELPITQYTYGFITTCYQWRKKNPDYHAVFYRSRENKESGTFVGLLYSGNKTFGLIPYARTGYENDLQRALQNTARIDWERLPLIQGILPRHTSVIESVVRAKHLQPKLYTDTTIHVLDAERALNYNIKCPEDVLVRRLTKDDVDTIYELWPHKDVWTVDEIRHSVELSPSYGVVSREDNELQAWVMHVHYGALGMLYTRENVRRNGYAKILIMALSKAFAQLGIQPFASIVPTNIKSITLFHSLGYKFVGPLKYISVCRD